MSFTRVAICFAMFVSFTWAFLMVAAAIFPPRSAEASELKWLDLPGQFPPSMVRFVDQERGTVCYYIPGSYVGLGIVYSPALSCVKQ